MNRRGIDDNGACGRRFLLALPCARITPLVHDPPISVDIGPAMTLAYACVLAAAFLPYVWTVIAKRTGSGRFNNHDPRQWLEKQENPRVRRADAAQKNAFEAFPAFAAAVLMAQLAGVDPRTIGWLGVAFVIARVLHGVFYIGNRASMRSLVWAAGYACVIALMVMAVLRIA